MTTNRAFLLLCTLSAASAFAPDNHLRTRWQPLITKSVGVRPLMSPKVEPSASMFVSPTPPHGSSLQSRAFAPLYVSLSDPELDTEEEMHVQEMESWEDDSKLVELVLLVSWGVVVSTFILMNNYVGPWPAEMAQVPERVWFVLHMLGGMLFSGGIILTTCIEWLVAQNRNAPVLSFWFDKVPLLDAVIVLPALTMAMVSGTGLAIEHYGGLGVAPVHISLVFYLLVAFAVWWAATDLTTQGKALVEVNEWAIRSTNDSTKPIPEIVHYRKISNVVSCLFCCALYAVMVFKPGYLIFKDAFPMLQ